MIIIIIILIYVEFPLNFAPGYMNFESPEGESAVISGLSDTSIRYC